MCAPSPPPPPDYAGAAQAQGAANIDTARATAKLNNPNVINPYGTQTVTYGSTPTLDQTAYDNAMARYQSELAAYNAAPTTTTGGRRDEYNDIVGGTTTAKTAPVLPNQKDFMSSGDQDVPTVRQTFSPEQQGLYDKSVQTKGLLGDLSIQGANALKGLIGTQLDFSGAPGRAGDSEAIRRKVIDAMMGRANEDYSKQTDQMNSDLIARGIRPGTKAYADQQQMIERSRNDARSQAEVAGGNAASQAFNMDAQRRKDFIAELLAQRQTPLNEISALMSGSQVSNPFSMPGVAQNSNIAPPPIFGAAQAQDQANAGIYNAQSAGANSTMNGLMSAVGTGVGLFAM